MKKHEDNQRRRPQQSRALVTYDSILEAAVQILEQRGPGAFNTNAVAERAGVSIGTLYQYFSDKDAILLAIAKRECAKPDVPLHKALMEALARALESLLGGRATRPGAKRVARTAIARMDVSKMEALLLEWLMPARRLAPVVVRRPLPR